MIPDIEAALRSLPPKKAYAYFFGEINQISGQKLMEGISAASRDPDVDEIHILFQSYGGIIGDGISLYNFIRKAPMKVVLYNTGTICSIASVVYLGAPQRVANQHATFMIHRSFAPQNTIPTAERLKAAVSNLKIDDERTEAILREHLNIPRRRWSDLRHKEFWFTAEDAVTNGMATEIGDFAPPAGAKVFTFC